MSRIGKLPVVVPSGVDVTIEGQDVTVKGPKGLLSHLVADPIRVSRAAWRSSPRARACSPTVRPTTRV